MPRHHHRLQQLLLLTTTQRMRHAGVVVGSLGHNCSFLSQGTAVVQAAVTAGSLQYAAASTALCTTSSQQHNHRHSTMSGGHSASSAFAAAGVAGAAALAAAAGLAAAAAAGVAPCGVGEKDGAASCAQQQQQLYNRSSHSSHQHHLQPEHKHHQQQRAQSEEIQWHQQLLVGCLQRFTAAADAAQPPQQQQPQQMPTWATGGGPTSSSSSSVGGGEPLSGAIALLDEDGLTNHPLDYNPITNEHTAAMTLAKQAGLEAYQAGRYAEAERRFKEALSEARLGFPPSDPHIPSALHYLAEFYRNTGRLDDAEPLYRETLQQLSDSLGERHWMYSAALCSLAALHEAKGEYGQAIQLLETALELRRQLFSSSSFLYADTAALLAKTLMMQHKHDKEATAARAAAEAAASNNSSSGGGWYGKLLGSGSSSSSSNKGGAGPPSADVLRAIQLWQQAVRIVEDSGSVVDTPVVSWLLDVAAAQQTAGQAAAAVDSLQKALQYMALPPQQQQQEQQQQGGGGQSGGNNSSQQQQQQALRGGSSSSSTSTLPVNSSNISAPIVVDDTTDTMTAVLAASGGNVEVARAKLGAMASEVAERLVDAQLAAGDVQGARATLRQALEARIALLGRHLVVAKTMTRLANLLMAPPPPDPSAPQLSPHFASSAVAIADSCLQTAQRANLWGGMVRGALKAVQTASFGGYKAGLQAEQTVERLLAAIQLGNASLALAAAEKMNGRLPEAEAALRHGVAQLRWVLGVGAADLQRLNASALETSRLQRVAGLLVDLKLLQMDCLEGLAALVRQQHDAASAVLASAAAAGSAGSASGGKKQSSAKKQAAAAGGAGGGGGGVDKEPAEVVALLGEADRLAAELFDDE